MRPKTLSELIGRTLSSDHTVYEREPSTRDRSVREMRLGPHRIRHRFPVRGGLAVRDLIIESLMASNSLLARL